MTSDCLSHQVRYHLGTAAFGSLVLTIAFSIQV